MPNQSLNCFMKEVDKRVPSKSVHGTQLNVESVIFSLLDSLLVCTLLCGPLLQGPTECHRSDGTSLPKLDCRRCHSFWLRQLSFSLSGETSFHVIRNPKERLMWQGTGTSCWQPSWKQVLLPWTNPQMTVAPVNSLNATS